MKKLVQIITIIFILILFLGFSPSLATQAAEQVVTTPNSSNIKSAHQINTVVPSSDTPQTECTSGGYMWVSGAVDSEASAQVQQELIRQGIESEVVARSYGEMDDCGSYNHMGLDLTITLTETELSAQSDDPEIIDDVISGLAVLEGQNLGNINIVDLLGNVTPIDPHTEYFSTDVRALDTEPLPADAIFKNVYVIVYDPLLINGQTLSEYKGWNNHTVITQQTVDFFKQSSSNKLNYSVVETTIVTSGWPELIDGFTYTEESYMAVLADSSLHHTPTQVNYNKIVNTVEFDICGKLNRGEIDEVWIYNGPWFGFYESTLVGPGAYWLNSSPISGSHECDRLIPIMGPSVERTVDEAVHNFTHRTESTMAKVYGSWSQNNTSHNWNKFALVNAQSPNYSYSGCGSSHYPPNATSDYNYANSSSVLSNCDDFYNFPNLSDPVQVAQSITCSPWGCASFSFYDYWFKHMPSYPGCGPDAIANDWWKFIANPSFALYPSRVCQSDMRMISGNSGVGGAIMSYNDGVPRTVVADSYGNYFLIVPNHWSGSVTPGKDSGYVFTPANINYIDVESDQYIQNYTAASNGPEIIIKGNGYTIVDGDTTPSTTDRTNFGSTPVAGGTVSRTFTIQNTGTGTLNLTGSPKVVISGVNASDFTVLTQPSSPIAPAGSTTLTVVFDPSSVGLRSASISISNDDSTEDPYNFSIQGTGSIFPEIEVWGNGVLTVDGDNTPSPTDNTDFGSVSAANGSISKTFTVYNTGNDNLVLGGTPKVDLGGTHSSDFSVTVQPSSPIAPSGSSNFTVVFDPNAVGLRTASISIANNDSNENPYNFSIQGTGLPACLSEIIVVNHNNDGAGSLRQSIMDVCAGGIISFGPSLEGETIHLVSELVIDKSIIIYGGDLSSNIKISGDTDGDGNGDVQIMTVTSSSAVKIYAVDIVNGKNQDYIFPGGINNLGSLEIDYSTLSGNKGDTGGAILNQGNLIIVGCTFNNNSANEGGAILNIHNASTTIDTGTFTQNSALGVNASGGAIGNLGDLTINGAQFIENSATLGGGAITNGAEATGTTIISTAAFSSNTTDGKGGAIYIADGNFTILDSTFSLNTADTGGGAIFISSTTSESDVTISSSVFSNNTTNWNGGAILNQDRGISISNSEFIDNIAGSDGGAIVNSGDLSVFNSEFIGNVANGDGGAISSLDTLTVTNSTLSNNSGYMGGAIANLDILAVTNSTVTGNSAEIGGGGILNTYDENNSGVLTITNSIISANTSDAGGGILNLAPSGEATISNSTISENSVSSTGGGVSNFGTLAMENSTLFGNSAENGGGIINFDTLTMANNTLSDNSALSNGGGLYNSGTLHMINTIMANSLNGEDCFNYESFGVIGTNINNLVENNAALFNQCGAPSSNSDPNLDSLANNGGPTQTMALLPGSPAIDAGDDASCPETDQRGVTRPQGSHCDIGAFEFEEMYPLVSEIIAPKARPNLTTSVDFIVKFSETVFGVNFSDFQLLSPGLPSAAITGVSGSGDTYTVSVYTGTGKGTLQVNLLDNDTIINASSIPLGGTGANNGNLLTGEVYPVVIRESAGGSSTGVSKEVDPSFKEEDSSTLEENNDALEAAPTTDNNETSSEPEILQITVSASNGSTDNTVILPAPKRRSPMDKAVLSKSPTFHWTRIAGGALYQFEYDNNPDFSSPAFRVNTSKTYYLPPRIKEGAYYWHIKVRDAAGNWSQWSPTYTIRISAARKKFNLVDHK